jgi:hypothetical protein
MERIETFYLFIYLLSMKLRVEQYVSDNKSWGFVVDGIYYVWLTIISF